ncbi:MAG: hypothetical protein V3V00_16655 [Saprospiraceae bacterium]
MKSTSFLILLLTMAMISSCSKDYDTAEIFYTKAIAKYGNLDEIRKIPLLGNVQTISNPGKIFVSDQFLLIGEEGKGIHLLDNSNPENPQPISFINVPGNHEFFVHEQSIFAESYYDMLKIDFSIPRQPRLVSRVKNYFQPHLLNSTGENLIGFDFQKVTEKIRDNDQEFWNEYYLYNDIYVDHLQAVITHSAVPSSFAGSSQSIGSVNRITRTKGHVYAINRSKMAVFSDHDELALLGEGFYGSQMESIYPNGDHLFIGGSSSIEILNITNPAKPHYSGSFLHPTSCDPVYPIDSVAYVTLRTDDDDICPGDVNALVVLDITDVRIPQNVQEIEMLSPFGISLIGDVLYVGEGENGLKIFDATDRHHLVLLKHDQSLKAYDVISHPTRMDLILVAGPHGFGQYSVTNTIKFSLLSWISF